MEAFQFFFLLLFAGEEEETIISYITWLSEGEGKFVCKLEHCYTFDVRMGESMLVDPLALRSPG